MGHICALLLSGSDIRFLGITGPEPEPEPDGKNSQISGHPELEPDIRYVPTSEDIDKNKRMFVIDHVHCIWLRMCQVGTFFSKLLSFVYNGIIF